jgi:hypothetical protein
MMGDEGSSISSSGHYVFSHIPAAGRFQLYYSRPACIGNGIAAILF